MTSHSTFEIQASFNLCLFVFISMSLFKTSKTRRRTYLTSVKPVITRSNHWLKMRLIEGVTELRMSELCQKRKFQRQV